MWFLNINLGGIYNNADPWLYNCQMTNKSKSESWKNEDQNDDKKIFWVSDTKKDLMKWNLTIRFYIPVI